MTDKIHSGRQFQVFLSHSSADRAAVQILSRLLESQGFALWLDEVDLPLGQPWQKEIEEAVQASDVVLVCFSRKSVTQEGYVQKEIELALDLEKQRPPGIFIIPVRLEEVKLPQRLMSWNPVDLFHANGYEQLTAALISRAQPIGASVIPLATTTELKTQSRSDVVSSADFSISFDPDLSPEQIRSTLQVLADYYRVCGGVGFEIDFELEEARAPELANV